jgi:hypothetical protein
MNDCICQSTAIFQHFFSPFPLFLMSCASVLVASPFHPHSHASIQYTHLVCVISGMLDPILLGLYTTFPLSCKRPPYLPPGRGERSHFLLLSPLLPSPTPVQLFSCQGVSWALCRLSTLTISPFVSRPDSQARCLKRCPYPSYVGTAYCYISHC